VNEDTSMVKICVKCGNFEIEKIEDPEDRIVESDGTWICQKCLDTEGGEKKDN